MQRNNSFVVAATLGPLGYVPASGTIATAVTLPIIFIFSGQWYMQLFVFLCVLVVSIYAIARAQTHLQAHDPAAIVIDEVVGCLITFFAIQCSWWSIIVGFLLFRFFDIFKPWPISRLEHVPGPWGVLLDDIGAGVVSNIILHILIAYSII